MTIKFCFSEKEKQCIHTVNYLLYLPAKLKGKTFFFCYDSQENLF